MAYIQTFTYEDANEGLTKVIIINQPFFSLFTLY